MSDSLKTVQMAGAFLATWCSRKPTLKQDVARAFQSALNETEIYFGDLQRAGRPRRMYAVEAKLARMWSGAAMLAGAKCLELSEACMLVSQFWGNPPMEPASPESGFESLLISLRHVLGEKREDGNRYSIDAAA